MKKYLLLTGLISFGVFAQGAGVGTQQGEAYSPNNGVNPPGTFSSLNKDKTVGPVTSKTGVDNSSGVKTDEVNSAVNPSPENDAEVMGGQTLKSESVFKTGPYNHDGDYAPKTDEEIQAEEERDSHKNEMDIKESDTKERDSVKK